MANAKRCDRCKDFIEKSYNIIKTNEFCKIDEPVEQAIGQIDHTYEICDSCRMEFNWYLNTIVRSV